MDEEGAQSLAQHVQLRAEHGHGDGHSQAAGLAFVAAYMIYQSLVEKEKAKAAGFGGVAGGMEDE